MSPSSNCKSTIKHFQNSKSFFFQLSKNQSLAGFTHVQASYSRLKLLLSTEICISIAGSHDPAAVSREHNEALGQFANTSCGLQPFNNSNTMETFLDGL